MYHTRIIPTPFREGAKQSLPVTETKTPAPPENRISPLFLLLPLFLAKKKDGP